MCQNYRLDDTRLVRVLVCSASMGAGTKEQRGSTAWRGAGLWPAVTFDKPLSLLTSARRALSYQRAQHRTPPHPHPPSTPPLPQHVRVSSIKALMDVLVLCHVDDSMLICGALRG